MRRKHIEAAVLDWLGSIAYEVDELPMQHDEQSAADRRAEQAAARERLEKQLNEAKSALTRLIADQSKHPDKYPEGAFEAARDELTWDRDQAQAALDKLATAEAQPTVEDFRPIVVGLLEEWDTFTISERNIMLRRVLRRVAVVDTEDGGKGFELHPKWEPDPWVKPAEADTVGESPAG